MKRFKILVCLSVFLMLFNSCASVLSVLGPGDKRKGIVFADLLQKVEADYVAQTAWPDLTDDEIVFLSTKRKALVSTFYGGKDMRALIDEGKPVPENLMNNLFRWLNDLQRGTLRPIPQSLHTTTQNIKIGFAQDFWTNDKIEEALVDAGIIHKTQAQMDPMLLGILIELFRTSIHFATAIIEMRNMTQEMIDARWIVLSEWLKNYNVTTLPLVG